MEQVRRCHETLMQQRTHIRHHKSILAWMRRVWTRVPRADTQRLTIDEYEDFYSTLLYEMTVCWEEEVNNSVLDKMWKRDAAHFDHLDFDRFCCSIFYFVEMWVEEITRDEYERIFAFIHRISMGNSNTAPSTTTAFKPTLESFHSALDNEQTMEDMALNIGKSIFFDAERYYQSFGTASIPTQIVAPLCVPNQGSGSLDAMTKAGTADHEAAERNSVMASLHQVPNRPWSSSPTKRRLYVTDDCLTPDSTACRPTTPAAVTAPADMVLTGTPALRSPIKPRRSLVLPHR